MFVCACKVNVSVTVYNCGCKDKLFDDWVCVCHSVLRALNPLNYKYDLFRHTVKSRVKMDPRHSTK